MRRLSTQHGSMFVNLTRRNGALAIRHRHYPKEQMEALAVDFMTVDFRCEGGILFMVMLIGNYIWEKMFGT